MPRIKDIWERLPRETQAAYGNFCAYRDMVTEPGDTRSLRRLAEQLHKNHKTLGEQSSKYNWVERCDAYDAELERRARVKRERDLLKMRADHALLGNNLVRKAVRGLLALTDEELTARDVARLADVGVKIERLSRGESTENQKISGNATVHHTGHISTGIAPLDLSSLSEEELNDLDGILQKIADHAGVQPADAAGGDPEGEG